MTMWPWPKKPDEPAIPWPQSYRITGELRCPRPGEWFLFGDVPYYAAPSRSLKIVLAVMLEVTDDAWLRTWAHEVARRDAAVRAEGA